MIENYIYLTFQVISVKLRNIICGSAFVCQTFPFSFFNNNFLLDAILKIYLVVVLKILLRFPSFEKKNSPEMPGFCGENTLKHKLII